MRERARAHRRLGRLLIQRHAPGTYLVTVTAAGFGSGSNSVEVNSGPATTQNFALTANAHTVVFSNSFESGNLSAWTTSHGFGLETSLVHSGQFAAEANATNGATSVCARGAAVDVHHRLRSSVHGQPSSTVNVLRLNNASAVQIAYLYVSPTTKTLGMTAGKTFTSTTTVSSGVFHELEMEVTLSGATSTTHVWLDGTLIAALSRTVTLQRLDQAAPAGPP